MSEYTEVEQPFLQQLETLGWTVIDRGREIPHDPGKSLRQNFRQWILPHVFEEAVSAINTTVEEEPWLTERQLHDLHDQILRQPNRTLLEANEAIQKLLFKAQVVCHSKLAAVRYQAAIQDALQQRLAEEKAAAQPDLNRIKQLAFLKAAVVISGDGTNEAAYVTEARKQARAKMKVLMEAVVDILQESIGSIDFWTNADKQKKIRSEIKTALMLTGINELKQNRERVAVEIMELAKNRHDELLKGAAE